MLSNLKTALALLCLFAFTVDALRASSIENLMKKRRQMLYRRRDIPPVKREVPAQWATVRPTLFDDPRDPWWLIRSRPAPHQSLGPVRGYLPEQVLVQRHLLQARRSCVLCVIIIYQIILLHTAHVNLEQFMTSERPTPKVSVPRLR